jgi:hypothetical protein
MFGLNMTPTGLSCANKSVERPLDISWKAFGRFWQLSTKNEGDTILRDAIVLTASIYYAGAQGPRGWIYNTVKYTCWQTPRDHVPSDSTDNHCNSGGAFWVFQSLLSGWWRQRTAVGSRSHRTSTTDAWTIAWRNTKSFTRQGFANISSFIGERITKKPRAEWPLLLKRERALKCRLGNYQLSTCSEHSDSEVTAQTAT